MVSVFSAFRELAALGAPRGEVAFDDLARRPSEDEPSSGLVDHRELAAVPRQGASLLTKMVVEIPAQAAQIVLEVCDRRGGGRSREHSIPGLGGCGDRLAGLLGPALDSVDVGGEDLRVADRTCEICSADLLITGPGVTHRGQAVPRVHAVDVTLGP